MIRYASVISLPNIRLYFPREKFSKEYLLIAGGRPPAVSWLQDAAADRVVYCIDHGADVCRAANLTPLFFIGDCDSVSADTLQWIRSLNVDFIQFPTEKDKTDTQLTLDRFRKEQDIFVIMTGGFGGRFDHLFSLLHSFAGTPIHGCIADDLEFLLILRDEETAELELQTAPKSVSLLPLSPQCTGVHLNGVHWPLRNAVLSQSNPYAISNRLEASDNRIAIRNQTGILAVYLCWQSPME